MRTGLLWVVVPVVTIGIQLNAQTIGGQIHFMNKDVQSFQRMECVRSVPFDSGVESLPCASTLSVFYKGNLREISFDKLSSLSVIPSSIEGDIVTGQLSIVTKTNISFTTPATIVDMWAMIYDELQGVYSKQLFAFARDGRLLIRKIEFY